MASLIRAAFSEGILIPPHTNFDDFYNKDTNDDLVSTSSDDMPELIPQATRVDKDEFLTNNDVISDNK